MTFGACQSRDVDAPHSLPPSRLDALHGLLDLDRLAEIGVDRGATALADGADALTWAEVHDAVARLSGAIVAAGVAPGDRVAVHMRKSVWSFVTVHAVVRAGGVMVPLDPMAPPGAVRRVLAEASPTILVSDAAARVLAEVVADASVETLVRRGAPIDPVDGVRVIGWGDALGHEPAPPAEVGGDAAAYIIFTSGSTGRPKGIVHTHASALAYARRAAATYGIGPSDVLANIASLHFDQSTFELYAGPLAGAEVLVIPDAVLRFPASATELIERFGVTVVYTVPYVLRQFVDRGALDQRDLSSVRWIKFGGEVYPPGELAALRAAVPSARLSNVYGPAEVNQCTHHHLADGRQDAPVPIGRPWWGTDVRVCDRDGSVVAVGDPGELWVATPTMMVGYWRRPELTAASVVERDGRRWYRTGDLVRWSHGDLEFLGRDDHQVKVRGQRVEIEAVEAALADVSGVVEAGVVAIDPGDAGTLDLVAAVIVDGDLDPVSVRAELGRRLGPAAVPTRIVAVDRLPRTSNGKVDRGAVREALLNGVVETDPSDPNPSR